MTIFFDSKKSVLCAQQFCTVAVVGIITVILLGIYILPNIIATVYSNERNPVPPIVSAVQWAVFLTLTVLTVELSSDTAKRMHRQTSNIAKGVEIAKTTYERMIQIMLALFGTLWVVQLSASIAFALFDSIDVNTWAAIYTWSFVTGIGVHFVAWTVCGVLWTFFTISEEPAQQKLVDI